MKHLIFTLAIIFIMVVTTQGQWEILNEGENFSTIDFANDSVGWIVGGGNIFKTEDGGNTWNKISKNDDINIHKIYFLNESVGWAISDNGIILKSLNGGSIWIIQEEFIDTELIELHVVNESTVYISAHSNDHPTLIKTVDGGDNWTVIPRYENDRKYHSIWFQDTENGMFIGTEYNHGNPVNSIILRTNDGGNTFDETIISTYNWMDKFQIINDSTAYFIGGRYSGDLCITKDTLNSWTQYRSIESFFSLDETTIFAVVYENTVYSFKKSTDGGVTWEQKSSLYWFGDYSSFKSDIYFRNEDVGFIVGGELIRYILQTFDGGDEWQIQKFDVDINDIFFIDRYKGLACGGGRAPRRGSVWGGMFVSDDGGHSWIKNGPGGKVLKVDFVDPLIGYTLSLSGGGWWYETHIHKTIDGGNSWDEKQECSGARDLIFRDSQQGWVVGRNGYNDTTFIIQTTDGGNNWEYVWETTMYDGLNSICDVEGTLWAVGDSGLIVTSVGPDSFEVIGNVTDLPLNDVFFSDAQHGWITGGNFSFFKTIDSGQSWNQLPNFVYDINDMFFEDSLHGWLAGSDTSNGLGIILESSDGGENWNVIVDNLSAPLTALHFIDGYGWAAGGNGLVLRTDGGSTWIDQNTGQTYPNKLTLKQNYPNPFNPSTIIDFSIPKTEFVTLKIYNLLGQEVAILISKKLNQGNHSYTFDGKNLASGIYYYPLVAGDFRGVKKMILLK